MSDEDQAVISLPDRLAHILDFNLDECSMASAPMILQRHSVIVATKQRGSTKSHDIDTESTSATSCNEYDDQDKQCDDDFGYSGCQTGYFCGSMLGSTTPDSRYKRVQLASPHRVLCQNRKEIARLVLSKSSPWEDSDPKQTPNEQKQNCEIFRDDSINGLLLYENPSMQTINSNGVDTSLEGSAVSSIICLRKRTIAPNLSADHTDEALINKNRGDKKEMVHDSLISCEGTRSAGASKLPAHPSVGDTTESLCTVEGETEEEGEEHTLGDFEDNIELHDLLSTLQISLPSPESSAEKSAPIPCSDNNNLLFQPSLQDETPGLAFPFDRVFQCFHQSQDQINISPQTFDDSLPLSDIDDEISHYVGSGGSREGGIACLMPSCCHDDFDAFEDFANLDESTIGREDLREWHLNESLLESHSYTSDSLTKHLELDGKDPIKDKCDLRNETMATEGDSTLNDSMMMY